MGDRANIVIEVDGDPPLYLYTHWEGYRIEQIAADGIREAIKGGRLTDTQYGPRILVDVFLRAHADSPHTGAGISTELGDGDGHMVKVDLKGGTVDVQSYTLTRSFSVEEFLAAYPAEARAS